MYVILVFMRHFADSIDCSRYFVCSLVLSYIWIQYKDNNQSLGCAVEFKHYCPGTRNLIIWVVSPNHYDEYLSQSYVVQ